MNHGFMHCDLYFSTSCFGMWAWHLVDRWYGSFVLSQANSRIHLRKEDWRYEIWPGAPQTSDIWGRRMKIGDIKNRPGAPQQTCDSSQNFAARNIPNIFLITPFLYHPFPYKCTHFAHIPSLILLSVNQLNINRSHSAKKPQHFLMYTSKIEIEFKPLADHTYCMTYCTGWSNNFRYIWSKFMDKCFWFKIVSRGRCKFFRLFPIL